MGSSREVHQAMMRLEMKLSGLADDGCARQTMTSEELESHYRSKSSPLIDDSGYVVASRIVFNSTTGKIEVVPYRTAETDRQFDLLD